MAKTAKTAKTTKTIVLDAGHYAGYNPSPAVPAYREGDMTWQLYLLLKKELEKKGFRVIGTREDKSRDVMVYDRGYMARGADLFISLHSNAVDSPSVRRVVVIPPYRDTYATYYLANVLGAAVTDVMQTGQRYQIYTRTYVDGNGKTRDYYGVIRGAVDAGCKRSMIIEHGFHTNRETALWLSRNENLKALAVREAETIEEFFRKA